MKLVATIVMASLTGLLGTAPAGAQAASAGVGAGSEALAQSQPRRARTKVRVRPFYSRQPYHSLFPPAYDVRYPGPNARRECVARYVQEHRPSGTVIVPRMRCWWVRG
ncbi:MAG: hypothetical protein EXQ83_11875 [Xanthobacteraceae bacterium]|nr:hypothetical protein [Xanthobacteraceae bacterium]